MASDPPKVFISYSHDSPEHAQHVLELAERLRKDGFDVQIDQYVAGTPVEAWPRWMLNQLDWADFVLVVCTETYYRRFRGHEELAKGKGADWEGNLITLELYHVKGRTIKFAPVLLDGQNARFIPEPLSGHTQYLLNSEENYDKLYAFLVGQAGVTPSELGSLKKLAPNPVEPLSFGAANTLTRRTTHNLPFARNPAFSGRDEELNELDRMLRSPRKEVAIQVVIVHGLGGVGKTQLAVEYAWKRLDDYDAVLWVKADNQEVLNRGLAELAFVLRLSEAGEGEQIQINAVLNWLFEHERWLLIAGDAETDEAVSALFGRLSLSLPGKLLVTSRISNWPVEYQELEILPLSLDAATDYLLKRVPKEYNAGDESAARLLADELGNLPLALEQAASFIIEAHWRFDTYREQLGKVLPQLLSYDVEGAIRYGTSVTRTWSITLERLDPLSHMLLRLAAWFAPDLIPRNIFSAKKGIMSEALGKKVSDLDIDMALGQLGRFSMIHLAEKTVSVQRLVQAFEQDSLEEEERKQFLLWAVQLFNAFEPGSPDDVRTCGVWVSLSSHAETLIEHTKRYGIEALPIAVRPI